MTENDYRLLYDISSRRIEELEQKLEQTEKDLADYQFNYPTIKELEKENRLLGERCTQLLKDKGNLTDELQELKALAKEVIKSSVVLLTKPRTALDTKTYIIKAEQFLKE